MEGMEGIWIKRRWLRLIRDEEEREREGRGRKRKNNRTRTFAQRGKARAAQNMKTRNMN